VEKGVSPGQTAPPGQRGARPRRPVGSAWRDPTPAWGPAWRGRDASPGRSPCPTRCRRGRAHRRARRIARPLASGTRACIPRATPRPRDPSPPTLPAPHPTTARAAMQATVAHRGCCQRALAPSRGPRRSRLQPCRATEQVCAARRRAALRSVALPAARVAPLLRPRRRRPLPAPTLSRRSSSRGPPARRRRRRRARPLAARPRRRARRACSASSRRLVARCGRRGARGAARSGAGPGGCAAVAAAGAAHAAAGTAHAPPGPATAPARPGRGLQHASQHPTPRAAAADTNPLKPSPQVLETDEKFTGPEDQPDFWEGEKFEVGGRLGGRTPGAPRARGHGFCCRDISARLCWRSREPGPCARLRRLLPLPPTQTLGQVLERYFLPVLALLPSTTHPQPHPAPPHPPLPCPTRHPQTLGKVLERYFLPALVVLGVICGGIAARTYEDGATAYIKTCEGGGRRGAGGTRSGGAAGVAVWRAARAGAASASARRARAQRAPARGARARAPTSCLAPPHSLAPARKRIRAQAEQPRGRDADHRPRHRGERARRRRGDRADADRVRPGCWRHVNERRGARARRAWGRAGAVAVAGAGTVGPQSGVTAEPEGGPAAAAASAAPAPWGSQQPPAHAAPRSQEATGLLRVRRPARSTPHRVTSGAPAAALPGRPPLSARGPIRRQRHAKPWLDPAPPRSGRCARSSPTVRCLPRPGRAPRQGHSHTRAPRPSTSGARPPGAMDVATPADQSGQEDDPEAWLVRFYISTYKASDRAHALRAAGPRAGGGRRGGGAAPPHAPAGGAPRRAPRPRRRRPGPRAAPASPGRRPRARSPGQRAGRAAAAAPRISAAAAIRAGRRRPTDGARRARTRGPPPPPSSRPAPLHAHAGRGVHAHRPARVD
jgi:hypothetical protein